MDLNNPNSGGNYKYRDDLLLLNPNLDIIEYYYTIL